MKLIGLCSEIGNSAWLGFADSSLGTACVDHADPMMYFTIGTVGN